MNHEPTIRIQPNADTAVLFIHGILGSPTQFRTTIPLEDMVPPEYSVCNVLLPGHGGTAKEFGNSSMAAWKAYAEEIFDALCQTHKRVILVGHSMGTLLALQLALAHPEKVSRLLLIEVPLRVGIKGFGARNIIRWSRGKLNIQDSLQASTMKGCSVQPAPSLWRYAGWIPRLLELIRFMHQTAKKVGSLTVPAIAYQSLQDELVSDRSARILSSCDRVDVRYFKTSTHFYFAPDEVAAVQECFQQILNQ